jgi:opacity protein-like surface antigen
VDVVGWGCIMGTTKLFLVAATVWGLCATAGFVSAQVVAETGGRVFGSVGGVGGDGAAAVVSSVGAGIRMAKHLGIDFEVLHATDLGLPTGIDAVIQTLAPTFAPVERVETSTLTSFLTRMTVEFPIAHRRLWPYITGGGGVGSLRQTVGFRNAPLPLASDPSLTPSIFPGPEFAQTSTDLALTIGGGLDVRVWKGLGVGADVRYFTLLNEAQGYDFALVLSRVAYRF